jgi:hypothetical protein
MMYSMISVTIQIATVIAFIVLMKKAVDSVSNATQSRGRIYSLRRQDIGQKLVYIIMDAVKRYAMAVRNGEAGHYVDF